MWNWWSYAAGILTVVLPCVALVAYLFWDITRARKPKPRVLDFEAVRRAQQRVTR